MALLLPLSICVGAVVIGVAIAIGVVDIVITSGISIAIVFWRCALSFL